MSIHIPSEVVFFLNILGIPYPDVDVDQVRELSKDVRDFGNDVRESFDAATNTLGDMGSALSGNSYQTILVVWSYRQEKMADLDSALKVAATAIDISADVIEAIQIAVLIEMAALAASFVAGMFTPAGAVTGPMIAAAARWLLKKMAEAIMWYIAAEVMMKAIEPLLEKFDQLIRDSLLPPDFALSSSPGADKEFYLDPDAVERYITKLESHAEEMVSHGDKLGEKLDRLDFATPGLEVPAADWPYPDTDEPLTLPSEPGALPTTLPSWVPDMMRTLPDWLPDTQKPAFDSLSGTTPDTATSSPGTHATGGPTDPSGPASSTNEPQHPATTSPNTFAGSSSADSSGAASTSLVTPSSAGTDSADRSLVSGEAGSTGDHYIAAGQGAEGTGTGSSQGDGTAGGVVPPGAVQSPASAPGQSQAAPAQNSTQRPAENAANKGQAGAGRGPAGAGPNTQQPSGSRTRSTPWSRAGKKPAPVASATERRDEAVPAISAGEVGDRDQTARKSQSDTGHAPQPAQVFAPDSAVPPTGPPPPETTGTVEQDKPESAPADAGPAPVGSRRTASE